jgi:UDP-3-O-[3-hydroxymyristoyl] glucosamine N-acyltransferase
VVTKDVGPGRHVTGIPAVDVEQWREATVLLRRLPELRERTRDLERRLSELERRVPKPR